MPPSFEIVEVSGNFLSKRPLLTVGFFSYLVVVSLLHFTNLNFLESTNKMIVEQPLLNSMCRNWVKAVGLVSFQEIDIVLQSTEFAQTDVCLRLEFVESSQHANMDPGQFFIQD